LYQNNLENKGERMKVNILYKPSYSLADVSLDGGEKIVAESGSMVAMSTDIEVQTKMKGGLMKSLARSVLGGESFFINTFQAGSRGGQIQFAPICLVMFSRWIWRMNPTWSNPGHSWLRAKAWRPIPNGEGRKPSLAVKD
jgi:hypothetical protein